jgi:MFS family permease
MSGSVAGTLFGVALWGLHMGLTQGLLSAMVAETAPPELRGTAFGLFNFAGGIAVLLASVGAGALWDAFGPTATFAAGAAVTALGLAGLMALRAGVETRAG